VRTGLTAIAAEAGGDSYPKQSRSDDVPCAVDVTGSGRINASIAAEGSISLTGTNLTIGPDVLGRPAVVCGATGTAVPMTGVTNRVLGAVHRRRIRARHGP
jgi:hypothetical protein